jgi:signal transduction histidine kinase
MMQIRNPLPLDKSISLMVAVIAIILAFVLQFVGLILTRKTLETTHRQNARVLCEMAAPQLESALVTESHQRLPLLLRQIQQADAQVAYAAVVLPEGGVMQDEFPASRSEELAQLLTSQSGGSELTMLNVKTERGDVLHMVRPLGAGVLGYLHVGVKWSSVDVALRQTCLNLMIAMLAGLMISAAIARFVFQRLQRPIVQLVKAAHQIGEGDLSTRVEERPNARDEAAVLATAFNQMASRLENHVDELVRSRTELGDEKSRIQAVMDSMAQSVLMVECDGRIIYFNQSARASWAKSGKAAPQSYQALRADFPEALQVFDEIISHSRTSKRLLHRVGALELSVTLSPVLGRAGEPLGIIEIATDVTEQMKAWRAVAHAEKLNVVGQLAAGVAHEINSPLDGAIEASRIIEKNAVDAEKVRRFASAQRTGLERIAAIVRRLLTFSRAPTTVLHGDVSIAKVLQEAQDLLKYRFTNSRVTLEVQGLQPWMRVQGDELGLVQVFVNLFGNAIDAMPDGGTIKVNVESEPAVLRISVIDGGTGVPPAMVGKLFMPFFTTKEVGKGTGLGLAISRNLVEEHGGQIIYSKAAAPLGACFTVTLSRSDLTPSREQRHDLQEASV